MRIRPPHPGMSWTGLFVAATLAACSACRSETPRSPTAPTEAARPADAGAPTPAPAPPAEPPEVTRLVRDALTPTLTAFLANDLVSLTMSPQPERYADEWDAAEPRVTFYFDKYAVDLPRGLIKALHNPWLFREGGGWVLAGDCRLTVFVDQELGLAATLRDVGQELDWEQEGLGELARDWPADAARVRDEVRRRLDFTSDLGVFQRMCAVNYQALDLDKLTAADLIETAALAGVKSVALRAPAREHLAAVTTRHYEGFALGRLGRTPLAWIELYDPGRRLIRFTVGCLPHAGADPVPLSRWLGAIVASTRPHGSVTPGTDLLAAARAELTRGPDDAAAAEIARCLVLCASRYDDAYDEAVALGNELLAPDTPYRAAYLAVLARATEPPREN